jgi:hypothetical protein
MRSASVVLLCGIALAAVAGLTVTAAAERTELAFTLGVVTTQIATDLRPGQQACQEPIDVRAAFGSVRVRTGTFFKPAPPIDMTIRDAHTRAELGRARIAPTSMQISTHVVRVPPVAAGREIAVCFRNGGRRVAGIYGGAGASRSDAAVEGRRVRPDMALVFLRERSISALSLLPEMFRRAALFHPGWVGAWTFWLLGALFLVLVPALLAWAVAGAGRA